MTQLPRLSASSIGAFKACPTRYRLGYVLRVRPIEDPDVFRQGTNWHMLLEEYRKAQREGSEDPVDTAIEHLNEAYQTVPDNKTPFEWESERAMLAYSFVGYVWHYQHDEYETLETELQFELPLINPVTGLPHRQAPPIVGKIDRTVRTPLNRKLVVEYKSTGSDIDSGADYWKRLRMDTQVSIYTYAARRLGLEAEGTLYDVYKKPGIRPKLLTQSESKKFMDTGEYEGAAFEVEVFDGGAGIGLDQVKVNGMTMTEIKPGKKEGTFQIRETPEMYGARLLNMIYKEPEKFFARRELVRTDKELEDFERELWGIYQTMRMMERDGNYFKNEQQCEATYKCPYTQICYHGQNQAVVDGGTPSGFKRLQPLTVGKT